jgi:peptidoglycan/LPS O-acetylase OafA/YrhL
MLFLGKLSFDIYLVHLSIICSLGSWLGLTLYPSLSSSSRIMTKIELGLIFCAVTGAVFLTAVVFSRIVDMPAIALGRHFSVLVDRQLSWRKGAMLQRLRHTFHHLAGKMALRRWM